MGAAMFCTMRPLASSGHVIGQSASWRIHVIFEKGVTGRASLFI